MATPLQARWEFTRAADHTWTWRRTASGVALSTSGVFPNYGATAADACNNGFRPQTDHWLVTSQGRTTHFRPGRAPINLPAGTEPSD